jgi:preprotein translocase subunit SecA
MWRALLDRLRGRPIERQLGAYRRLLTKTDALEPETRALGDEELRARARALRRGGPNAGGPNDADPDGRVPSAFALAREAARRALGERPFDEQVLAGLALADGKLAEMATGEGKTLAAVAPVFLHALAGRGVHVLTFNDYLARRDAQWMRPVYERLALSVGFVQERQGPDERRRAYGADVTYLTAKEAGFDHLRDGLVLEPEERVQRAFQFALVDEADSILIDEARIPLVIAGERSEPPLELVRLVSLVRSLEPHLDFDCDSRAHNIALTEDGARRVERSLGCGSLHGAEQVALLAQLRHALHAEHLLRRDVDYIVRDGRIELVDESTGRVADKRHWPDGLQAAVEAKEGLLPTAEGRILGSVTLQHFLRLYPLLAGMTATAVSAAEELDEFYGLRTVVIPTHRPMVRVDHPDVVFGREDEKRAALVAEIGAVHATGRPILVGTSSVAESERLAAALGDAAVPCAVLNAKNDEAEADLVSRAGAPGAVTISTNMAGRGTDIRLGGRDESRRDEVIARGGLYVIATGRGASLRIDLQLRGRAGRQGDPGASRFFVSLEDDIIRRYGLEPSISARHQPPAGGRPQEPASRSAGEAPSTLSAKCPGPIEGRLVHAEIARAQRIAEDEGFQLRRTLCGYSEIVERQRLAIRRWREAVLERRIDESVLGECSPERATRLRVSVPAAVLADAERRVTLLTIDRCWSDHLAELRELRDDSVLLAFAGRFPIAEFHRSAGRSFEQLETRIRTEVGEQLESLAITPDGVDWDAAGLRRPAATWTYLVGENPFGASGLVSPLGRTGMAAASLGAPWLVLLHGVTVLWARRRRRFPPSSSS